MPFGELATRISVWLALVLWLASECLALNPKKLRLRRWLFGLSAAVFLAHVILSFHVFYDWSQTTALADVRRQTRDVTGLEWSIGLWINYAFAALWLAEALWLCLAPIRHAERPRSVTWLVRGIFWFMAFNGAFVFVKGPQRWLGFMLCLSVIAAWATERKLARAKSNVRLISAR